MRRAAVIVTGVVALTRHEKMKYPPVPAPNSVHQALVLSGGGARAAYQVGCLRHIAKAIPEYRPKILTGVSAGAINAAQLAAYRGFVGFGH